MTHEPSRSSAALQRLGMAMLIASLLLAGYALVQSAESESASAGGARTVSTSAAASVAAPVSAATETVASPQIVAAPAQDADDDEPADSEDAADEETTEEEAPSEDSDDEVKVKVEYVGAETDLEVEVVTALPLDKGDDVNNGDVILEVSHRPLFVFEGSNVAVRTLGVGTTGDDVAQLELALVALGYNVGTADDSFDAATGAAIAQFYADSGYELPSAVIKDAEDLAEAQADLAKARSDREVLVIELHAEQEPDLVEANEDLRDLQAAEAEVAAIDIKLQDLRRQREPLFALGSRFAALRLAVQSGLANGLIDPDDTESVDAIIVAELDALVNDDPDDFDDFGEMFAEIDQEEAEVLDPLNEILVKIEEELLDLELAKTDVDLAWDKIYEESSQSKVEEIRSKLKAVDSEIASLEAVAGRLAAKTGPRMSIDEFVFVPNLPGEIDDIEVDVRDEANGTLIKIVS